MNPSLFPLTHRLSKLFVTKETEIAVMKLEQAYAFFTASQKGRPHQVANIISWVKIQGDYLTLRQVPEILAGAAVMRTYKTFGLKGAYTWTYF